MRFALLISAAFHGLILVSVIGVQFEDQQIEEEKQKALEEKILEEKEPQAQLQWMKKLLGFKAILTSSAHTIQWGKDTLSLNGMNAFHIATRYNAEILKHIFWNFVPKIGYIGTGLAISFLRTLKRKIEIVKGVQNCITIFC